MNEDRLLSLYEKVAEAPGAIPRLRRFVLDLAVRGKLVQQDPNDEPASELLKRIKAEKARLLNAGEIRKPKPTAPIDPSELPIIVPSNWAWSRLRDIGTLSGGMTPSKNQPDYWDGDVVWLSPKDIKRDEVSDSELKITKKGLEETRLALFPEGSLFIVARSGILKRTFPVSINRAPAASNQDLKVLVPHLKGQERYLQIMFRGMSDFLLTHLVKQGTTVQSLKYAEFEVQPFPLPPLAEQRRIVAKVEELMGLLDGLEAARQRREETRDRLTVSSLARLTAADAEPETFPTRARFALNTLPALTTRPDQIKQLRETILNLAVRGKLVEQDPNDEPASELLKRIALEKKGQTKGRKGASKEGAEDAVRDISLPRSWVSATLGQLSLQLHYGYTASASKTEKDVRLLRITDIQDHRVNWDTVPGCEIDAKTLPKYALEAGDLLIARTGGTIGKTFLVADVPVKSVFASYLIRVQPARALFAPFLILFCGSDIYWDQLRKGSRGGGQPNVNGQTLGRMFVPLPPLAEQRRIVAKADALMALCDQLEAALTIADTTRARLLNSLLHEALTELTLDREAA